MKNNIRHFRESLLSVDCLASLLAFSLSNCLSLHIHMALIKHPTKARINVTEGNKMVHFAVRSAFWGWTVRNWVTSSFRQSVVCPTWKLLWSMEIISVWLSGRVTQFSQKHWNKYDINKVCCQNYSISIFGNSSK